MYEYDQISDFDIFFFYGEDPDNLVLETESDIMAGIIQPKRSLYYNRQDSSGVAEKENFPNTIILQIMTRYDIVNWNNYRNQNVSDGSDDLPDRRTAISQNSIQIKVDDPASMNVSVTFIPFFNIKQQQTISMPMMNFGR